MKKLLTILSVCFIAVSPISTVIACSHKDVFYNQEKKVLLSFANKHNIQTSDIDQQTLKFINQTPKNNQQIINFNFNLIKNSTLADHTQLKKKYSGSMNYNLKNQQFKLIDNPFIKTPTYIPGNFDSSLGFTSGIFGNIIDFTIVADEDDLTKLNDNLGFGGATSLKQLFINMVWKNTSQFPDSFLKVLKNLNRNDINAWQIPQKYMALIHVQKQSDQSYKIIWSNLVNQDKTSLREASGEISSIFWKKNSDQDHLWLSKQIITEIYQLYLLDKNNEWFKKENLISWLNLNNEKLNKIEIANVPQDNYKNFNTNQSELINSIQNLIQWYGKNNNLKLFENKFINSKYKAFDFIFNYKQSNWIFDFSDSKLITKNN